MKKPPHIKNPKLRAHRRFQHLAYLQWLKATHGAKEIRQGKHRLFQPAGETLFAFGYSKIYGIHLAYKPGGIPRWLPIYSNQPLGPTGNAFPDWGPLAVRLTHWREMRADILRRISSPDDFRTFTRLTAYLAFTPPEKP